jgi:hypothetical protein
MLKIHEKTLDNSIDRFDTTVERLENVIQEVETMIIREKYGSIQIQIQEVWFYSDTNSRSFDRCFGQVFFSLGVRFHEEILNRCTLAK